MKITWKNVLKIPQDWNTLEVLEQRAEYVRATVHYSNRNVVYVDESGFNLHISKSKGRSLAGEPATVSLAPKGPRVSLMACLSRNGIVHTRLVCRTTSEINGEQRKRGVDAEEFRQFLTDLSQKIPRGSIIVMDNAKIHHAQILEPLYQMLSTTYNISTKFLPPYSPFLNPIEYAFNVLKMDVKDAQQLFNRGDLIKAINHATGRLTATQAEGFYSKALSFYSQASYSLPFTGHILEPDPLDDPLLQSPPSTRLLQAP